MSEWEFDDHVARAEKFDIAWADMKKRVAALEEDVARLEAECSRVQTPFPEEHQMPETAPNAQQTKADGNEVL